MLNNLRTPDGFLNICGGGDDSSVAFVKVLGPISVCCFLGVSFPLLLIEDGDEDGQAPGTFSGVVGCDVNGPPPGVGGSLFGVCGGDGISVPSVRETSTGVTVRANGSDFVLPPIPAISPRPPRLAHATPACITSLCNS